MFSILWYVIGVVMSTSCVALWNFVENEQWTYGNLVFICIASLGGPVVGIIMWGAAFGAGVSSIVTSDSTKDFMKKPLFRKKDT